MSPRRTIAALVAVASFAVVTPAHAAITASNITAPASGTQYLITDANPETNVAVTGTTNGMTGDKVDIRCYERGDSFGTGPTNVAVAADGSFTTMMQNGTPYGTCVLRAVPTGFSQTADASAFTGPTLTAEWNTTNKVAAGPNAGTVYDYYILFQGPNAMNDYVSATTGGLWDSRLQYGPGSASTYLWYENMALRNNENLSMNNRSFLQVDGRNAYGPRAAQNIFANSDQNSGFPALTYSAARDEATNNPTIHETDPIVVCPNESPFPPTAVSCPQFNSAGVRLERTIFTDDGGRQVHITDNWVSTDNAPHTLSAHYDEWVPSNNTADGAVHSGLRFPWAGDAFAAFSADSVIPGPSNPGPGTMFVKANNAVADGNEKYPVGALTFDVAPSAVRWGADGNWTLRTENIVVPAGGTATLREDFVMGQTLAEVTAKAAVNEDRYSGPAVSITSPANGSTVTGDGATKQVTVTGTTSDNRKIASLTLNGASVTPAADGSWSAPATLAKGANTLTAVATDGAGNSATATASVTYSQNAPVVLTPALSALTLSPATFSAAARGGAIAAKVGTTVSYTDSQAATTTFKVDRVLPGRKSGKRCVKQNARNRKAKKCTRYVRVRGSFTHADKAGKNSFRFTGRLAGRKLAPGKYRLNATPAAGGKTGATVRKGFKIVR